MANNFLFSSNFFFFKNILLVENEIYVVFWFCLSSVDRTPWFGRTTELTEPPSSAESPNRTVRSITSICIALILPFDWKEEAISGGALLCQYRIVTFRLTKTLVSVYISV